MKTLLSIGLAALSAFVATRAMPASPARAGGPDPAQMEALRGEILRLGGQVAEAERTLERRSGTLAPPPGSDAAFTEAQIEAAVERWRAAHPPVARAERGVASKENPGRKPLRPTDLPLDVAELSIPEIVRLLGQDALTSEQRDQLFQDLRDAGRIDEYVAEIERLAAADPSDPSLQVALGNAYLQKVFGMSGGPETGVWAMKSDTAFGQALVLDPENWEARFLKAVSLSNWPAFLGKGREAIDHFEILIEQQESMASRPEFAQTYLFYGNVLAANGEPDEALDLWRQGLLLFPRANELRQAIERAEGN